MWAFRISLAILILGVFLYANYVEKHGTPPIVSAVRWQWNCKGIRERAR